MTRQTGKTHRMLMAADRAAKEGHKVAVIVLSEAEVHRCLDVIHEMHLPYERSPKYLVAHQTRLRGWPDSLVAYSSTMPLKNCQGSPP